MKSDLRSVARYLGAVRAHGHSRIPSRNIGVEPGTRRSGSVWSDRSRTTVSGYRFPSNTLCTSPSPPRSNSTTLS